MKISQTTKEKNISNFNHDAKNLQGYVYTSPENSSAFIANDHITETILDLAQVKGKTVIDVGCGDGTYSLELLQKGRAKFVLGFDPSTNAIKSAKVKSRHLSNISFAVGNVYTFSPHQKFDIAIVRGVLHHLYQPEKALVQIASLAYKVVLADPNGYNLLLKIIEKVSKYHRDHEEKSYPPHLIDRWINTDSNSIITRKYTGTVPFFCPLSISYWLKRVEPYIENTPVLRQLLCGSYYVVFRSNSL